MLCWVSAAVVVTWYCFGIEAAAIVLESSDCFLCLFLCLFVFFFTRRVGSQLRETLRQPLHVPLSSFFFFVFFWNLSFLCAKFVSLWQTSGIVQLDAFNPSITRIPLLPQKQVTVVWLERPHAFLQLRILAYRRRKQPLKTMKEWVRQWRRQTEKIKAFRIKTLYQHSSDE